MQFSGKPSDYASTQHLPCNTDSLTLIPRTFFPNRHYVFIHRFTPRVSTSALDGKMESYTTIFKFRACGSWAGNHCLGSWLAGTSRRQLQKKIRDQVPSAYVPLLLL